MQSSIVIRGLRLYGYHGVMDQERKVGGWFIVHARVHFNIYKAMTSDSVADTLSYADLLQVLETEMAEPSCLLEHVAGRMARGVFRRFPQAEAIDLTLLKENPPMGANCEGAGVELHLINDKTDG